MSGTPISPIESAQIGRRKFLWSAAAGLVAVGAGASLVGCAGRGAQTAQGPAGEAKKGGTLHFGGQGGANTDTLDGQNALTNTDWCRTYQLFDGLVILDAQGQPKLSMAKSITPNADATEWTIVIPDGITTHKGKKF